MTNTHVSGTDLLFARGVQFYVLRKLVESELLRKGYNHRNAYIPSLSSQTIVYKGQLMPSQVCLGQALAG